jgi:hypothetical protein
MVYLQTTIFPFVNINLEQNKTLVSICVTPDMMSGVTHMVLFRGGTTRWCRVQKFTCWSTGSRYQYIVI